MQDRFKFRIWNKLANMMTYNFMLGNYMQISKVDYEKKDWVGVNYEPEYICFENEGIKNIEIMQSTGLKDKNGKLIYEGDIVKDRNNFILQITYRQNKGAFYLKNNKITGAISELKCSTNTMEVIGNKFQTPELLSEVE